MFDEHFGDDGGGGDGGDDEHDSAALTQLSTELARVAVLAYEAEGLCSRCGPSILAALLLGRGLALTEQESGAEVAELALQHNVELAKQIAAGGADWARKNT